MNTGGDCERSSGMESRALLVLGVVLMGLGVLPYLGVPIVTEPAGSWAFAIGLAIGFRGYSGGCLSGLIPGVQQCTVEAEGANER